MMSFEEDPFWWSKSSVKIASNAVKIELKLINGEPLLNHETTEGFNLMIPTNKMWDPRQFDKFIIGSNDSALAVIDTTTANSSMIVYILIDANICTQLQGYVLLSIFHGNLTEAKTSLASHQYQQFEEVYLYNFR